MLGKLRMLMGSGSILGYFLQALPVACLAGIIYSVMRWSLLKKRNARFRWSAELLQLIFVCYLTGLISLVILPANFWLSVYDGIFLGWWDRAGRAFQIGNVNLVPSVLKWLNGELSIGRWSRTMLLGNIAMFIPLGFLLPFIRKIKSFKKMLLISAAVPICCETLQLFFGRSFDVDDLICNFIGIVIGAVISFCIRKIRSSDAVCD